jgi:hypothetical protein
MAQPDRPQQRSIRYRIQAGFGLGSIAIEGDILRREAQKLREEFTAEKRDQLLQAIESTPIEDPAHRRAQAELAYYLTMFQVNSAERGTRQLAWGTWILAFATIGLFVATIVLAITTAHHH